MATSEGDDAPATESVFVAVRVRPFISEEYARLPVGQNHPVLCISAPSAQSLDISKDGRTSRFDFDRVYWSHNSDHPHYATQATLYQEIGRSLLQHMLNGFNTCIFAYGQTGSGKSYSVLGQETEEGRGLLPRCVQGLFENFDAAPPGCTCECVVSFLEIYNEQIRDLLASPDDSPTQESLQTTTPRGRDSISIGRESKSSGRSPSRGSSPSVRGGGELKIQQLPGQGVVVVGLTEVTVTSKDHTLRLIDAGMRLRTTGSTAMNQGSSRSHCIFTFKTSITGSDGIARRSQTHMVDLAGSERAGRTQAQGDRLKEGAAINKSLTTLSSVIRALAEMAEGKRTTLPPFRDSKLTYILKESLSGNSKTIMMAAISPSLEDYEETMSTLRFATTLKKVQLSVVANEQNMIELKAQQDAARAKVAAHTSLLKAVKSKDVQELKAAIENATREGIDASQVKRADALLREEEMKLEVLARLEAAVSERNQSALKQLLKRAREVNADGSQIRRAEVALREEEASERKALRDAELARAEVLREEASNERKAREEQQAGERRSQVRQLPCDPGIGFVVDIGKRVTVAGRAGTVRFHGATQFAAGVWVGVELDTPVGKNDGTVQGVQYFACPADHGVFVRATMIAPEVPLAGLGDGRSPLASASARSSLTAASRRSQLGAAVGAARPAPGRSGLRASASGAALTSSGARSGAPSTAPSGAASSPSRGAGSSRGSSPAASRSPPRAGDRFAGAAPTPAVEDPHAGGGAAPVPPEAPEAPSVPIAAPPVPSRLPELAAEAEASRSAAAELRSVVERDAAALTAARDRVAALERRRNDALRDGTSPEGDDAAEVARLGAELDAAVAAARRAREGVAARQEEVKALRRVKDSLEDTCAEFGKVGLGEASIQLDAIRHMRELAEKRVQDAQLELADLELELELGCDESAKAACADQAASARLTAYQEAIRAVASVSGREAGELRRRVAELDRSATSAASLRQETDDLSAAEARLQERLLELEARANELKELDMAGDRLHTAQAEVESELRQELERCDERLGRLEGLLRELQKASREAEADIAKDRGHAAALSKEVSQSAALEAPAAAAAQAARAARSLAMALATGGLAMARSRTEALSGCLPPAWAPPEGRATRGLFARAGIIAALERALCDASAVAAALLRTPTAAGAAVCAACCRCSAAAAALLALLRDGAGCELRPSLAGLAGEWRGASGEVWTLSAGGTVTQEGCEDGARGAFMVVDPQHGVTVALSDGWQLDRESSSSRLVVWRKQGSDALLWYRAALPEAELDAQGPAILAGAQHLRAMLEAAHRAAPLEAQAAEAVMDLEGRLLALCRSSKHFDQDGERRWWVVAFALRVLEMCFRFGSGLQAAAPVAPDWRPLCGRLRSLFDTMFELGSGAVHSLGEREAAVELPAPCREHLRRLEAQLSGAPCLAAGDCQVCFGHGCAACASGVAQLAHADGGVGEALVSAALPVASGLAHLESTLRAQGLFAPGARRRVARAEPPSGLPTWAAAPAMAVRADLDAVFGARRRLRELAQAHEERRLALAAAREQGEREGQRLGRLQAEVEEVFERRSARAALKAEAERLRARLDVATDAGRRYSAELREARARREDEEKQAREASKLAEDLELARTEVKGGRSQDGRATLEEVASLQRAGAKEGRELYALQVSAISRLAPLPAKETTREAHALAKCTTLFAEASLEVLGELASVRIPELAPAGTAPRGLSAHRSCMAASQQEQVDHMQELQVKLAYVRKALRAASVRQGASAPAAAAPANAAVAAMAPAAAAAPSAAIVVDLEHPIWLSADAFGPRSREALSLRQLAAVHSAVLVGVQHH